MGKLYMYKFAYKINLFRRDVIFAKTNGCFYDYRTAGFMCEVQIFTKFASEHGIRKYFY